MKRTIATTPVGVKCGLKFTFGVCDIRLSVERFRVTAEIHGGCTWADFVAQISAAFKSAISTALKAACWPAASAQAYLVVSDGDERRCKLDFDNAGAILADVEGYARRLVDWIKDLMFGPIGVAA